MSFGSGFFSTNPYAELCRECHSVLDLHKHFHRGEDICKTCSKKGRRLAVERAEAALTAQQKAEDNLKRGRAVAGSRIIECECPNCGQSLRVTE